MTTNCQDDCNPDAVMTGYEFQRMRYQLKMTQSDVAKYFNVALNTVYNWERSEQVPGPAAMAIRALSSQAETAAA